MTAVRGGRGEFVAAAVVFPLVLVPLLQWRYGYQAGTNDHLVLSLQGLQWGLPGFLAGDWFVPSAPQPHVLFDVATWAGAASGHLTGVYLAWWLLGLAVGGVATAVLAREWTPQCVVPASAVIATLIGLGPEIVLGSTSPALPTALPHQLGGFLAYLSAALILTRNPRGAAAATVATAAVHVQVGALAAVVAVLAGLVVRVVERQWWWSLLAGAAAAGAIVLTVLRLRPVAADGDDFVEICRDVIPYHCDATTWTAGQFGSGFAVVLAALLSVGYVVRSAGATLGLWAATVLAPAAGLTGGVLANLFEVPVIGRLAQTTNVFRLAVLVLPFAAWGLFAGFVRLEGRGRLAWLPPAMIAGFGWLVVEDGTPALPDAPVWAVAVLAVAASAVLLRGLPAGTAVSALVGCLALAVMVAGAMHLGVLRRRPFDPTFVASAEDRAMGELVARHVPVGEGLLVPPTFGAVRLTGGRWIVVDCKAVPYGGAAWREYRTRLAALGGRGACHSGGRPFLEVPAATLSDVALRYQARYLLLTARDPRADVIHREQGWRVLAVPSARSGDVWLLGAPGAPDAGA